MIMNNERKTLILDTLKNNFQYARCVFTESDCANFSCNNGKSESINYKLNENLKINVIHKQKNVTISVNKNESIEKIIELINVLLINQSESTKNADWYANNVYKINTYLENTMEHNNVLKFAETLQSNILSITKEFIAKKNSDTLVSCRVDGSVVTKSFDLIDTNNIKHFRKEYKHSFYFEIVTKNEKGLKEEGTNYYSDDTFNKHTFTNYLNMTYERSIEKHNKVNIKSGKYNILFNSETASSMLEAFIDSISNTEFFTSFYRNKLNEKIFHESVSIYNNPLAPKKAYLVDYNGIQSQNITIVENGILKNVLMNEDTGASKDVNINCGEYNIFLKNNDENLQNKIKELSEYICLHDTIGFDFNTSTGIFSFSASGEYYKNGEPIGSLTTIAIGGYLQNLFNNLTIGNFYECNSGGIRAPEILFYDVSVSCESVN